MNSHSRTIVCAASLLILAACGGKDSVASKSAAAYREAQAKGIPVGGGHTQHESAATATSAATDHSAHGTMDHSAHTATTDHSAHRATTDHSAHAAATDSVDHAAMGHGTAASAHSVHAAASAPAGAGHAQHGGGHAATASPGGGHAAHATASPSASHDQHATMQHGSTPSAAADPHAQHRTTATTPTAAPAPSSGTISTRIEPASTLRPDAFDAPVAASVAEAKKTGGTAAHGDHGAPADAAVYACPMHPEVTSNQPGTCPKCGMALVKRTKQ